MNKTEYEEKISELEKRIISLESGFSFEKEALIKQSDQLRRQLEISINLINAYARSKNAKGWEVSKSRKELEEAQRVFNIEVKNV